MDVEERDERKCLMTERDHCGRSPTNITTDYLPMLELSGDLFARKFDDKVDAKVKDVLDERRAVTRQRASGEPSVDKETRPLYLTTPLQDTAFCLW